MHRDFGLCRYTTPDGEIFIDPRVARDDTPIHEYSHLWTTAYKQKHPERWDEFVRAAKAQTDLWDYVTKTYKDLKTDDEIADEVFAHFSGKQGAERLREMQQEILQGKGDIFEKAAKVSAIEELKRMLKDVWRWIADTFHISRADRSIGEFADMTFRDLAGEVESRNVQKRMNMTPEERRNSLASETEDVAREDQIFLNEALGTEAESSSKYSRREFSQADSVRDLRNRRVKNVVITENDNVPMTRKEAIERLSKMVQPFHNQDQGVDIYVSNRDARHSMSFRNQDQISVIAKIDELINNAVKIGEEPVAEDEGETTKSVSIYYCPVNINGKQYSARMTVKTYVEGSHVLDEIHLYNYQLRDMTPIAQNVSPKLPVHPTEAISEYKVKDLIHDTQPNDNKILNDFAALNDLEEPIESELASGRRKNSRRETEARKAEAARQAVSDMKVANANVTTGADIDQSTSNPYGEQQAGALSCYDPETGRLTVVADNFEDEDDMRQHLLTMGPLYNGLHSMFGKDYERFLYDVFAAADEPTHRKIIALAQRRDYDFLGFGVC